MSFAAFFEDTGHSYINVGDVECRFSRRQRGSLSVRHKAEVDQVRVWRRTSDPTIGKQRAHDQENTLDRLNHGADLPC
jgi:hypothetical protein